MMLGHFVTRNGGKISGKRTWDVPSKYPRERSKLNVIMVKSTCSGPRMSPHLPQHLLDPHIRPRVARTVVSGEQQLQLFARLPGLALAQHPLELSCLR